MDKGCSGACGQGRNTCPTPFACEISEEVEDEVFDALEFMVAVVCAVVICFGVVVCL